MIVSKHLKFSSLIKHLYLPILYFIAVSGLVYWCYEVLNIKTCHLPTSIIAVMGTALAIFIGFRNSSSYDRWWEARKIWGGIVNYSRTIGRQATSLISLQHVRHQTSKAELKEVQKIVVYRHLAWINALRVQLRQQDNWSSVQHFLSDQEWQQLRKQKNKATQLIQKQGEMLAELLQKGLIEDFRHMQLDNTLTELYNLQGKAERIKNTPLPRQYDFFINIFLWCFVTLLPLTIIEPLANIGISWASIPLSSLIAFCFYVVAGVAAYNEDPFENRPSDTPMTALCRTIEIDLLEQLGEQTIPAPIRPTDGFLM